ncbi:hypothetical protein ACHAQH_007002 [Verticillium albo-atrum]
MRLIHAKTYELHEFFAGDVPPYAILSHTWADDEVIYHDIKNLNAEVKHKQGFLKIKYACDAATIDEIKYVWVDTCCIDKSSSAELSEAINSMYQWYRDAEVCYAYLEDFPEEMTGVKLAEPTTTGRKTAPDYSVFHRCRWFKRGWTLQELLAPPLVKFFSAGWASIGSLGTGRSKAATGDLADAISEATGINSAYLTHSSSLETASVATKMSWASRRECTRIEDTAYCLLGIFGINLPLLYGEGKRAFQRLQEEIWRETDDHSLLAWSVTPDDPRAWSLCSVFAESPFDFRQSGQVNRTGEERGVPSAMTKMGLKLDLVSVPWPYHNTSFLYSQPTHLLLLNCSMSQPLAVLALLDLPDGPFERPYTLFTRIATPSLTMEQLPDPDIPKTLEGTEDAPLDTVIVRKNVTGRRKADLQVDSGHAEVMLHDVPLADFHVSSHFSSKTSPLASPGNGAQTIAIRGVDDGWQPLTYLECFFVPKGGNERELMVLSCVIGMPGVGVHARWKVSLAFSRFNCDDGSHEFYAGVDYGMEKSRQQNVAQAAKGPVAPDFLLMDAQPEAPCDGMDLNTLAFQRFREDLAARFSQLLPRAAKVQGPLCDAKIEVGGKGTLKARLFRDWRRGEDTHTPDGRHGFAIILSLETSRDGDGSVDAE